MKHSLPDKYLAQVRSANKPVFRWGALLALLVLLSGPSAWAQTYLIGTNQTTCAGTIYDSGGAAGNYQDNENLTTVLTPATAGAKIRLTFTSFAVETCCDDLSIYDGPTTTSPLIGTYTSSPGTIIATNPTGQLTLVFSTDGSVVFSGFEATIFCATNVPSITSFTPTSGLPGTTVVITGTNFTGATAVSFNNIAATAFTVNSATQITATVPTGAATGRIRVTTPMATAISGTNFTVPAPTITSFTPTNGPAGTSVVITGTNFTGATAVSIGGSAAPMFVVNSATQITVTVPANSYSGSIVVTTPAGTATSTASYNSGNSAFLIGTNVTACSGAIFDSGGPTGDYQNNENLTTVLTPATAGAKIRLAFTSFAVETCCDRLRIYDGPSVTSPLIGTYTALPGTIVATNTTGQLTLVFTSDGSVVSTGFEATISCATNVPSITSFTPTSGLPGTSVVITGVDFTGATAVSFNNIAATAFVVNSSTQITATVPTGATTGPIRVTTPVATAISGTNFTVPAPTITSFTPTNGPAGTSVVITGTNFTGATAVSIGGSAAPMFVVNSATQITVTVPANSYSGSIVVTTPAGTATSTASYNSGNSAFLIGTNVTACSGTLFDSGGPTGNYQNNENLTTVLTPANGSKSILTFSAFSVETCCDRLRIYDGPSATSPLIGTYTSNPGTITATSATGELTLVFTSDGSVVNPGFEATISCQAPPTCTPVTNLTVSNITPTSANLNFTPGIGNNSYVVTYTPAGGMAQTMNATASPISLTGLASATPYTVSIQPICTVGTMPSTVTTATFTTLLPNDDPAGAVVIPVTANCTTPTSGSNLGATTTVPTGYNVPGCAPANVPKDVWYRFTTAATGATATAVRISVTGNPAGQVRVFSSAGGGAGPFTQLVCSASGAANTAAPGLTVSGLTASTTYYILVSGYGSGDTTGPFTICITEAPAMVTGLAVNSITSTSANLTFTPPTGATSYTVTYTPAGGIPTTVTTTSPPVSLTGLGNGVTYSVTVVANYPGGSTSAVVRTTFTTLQPTASRAAIGNGTLSVFPNPAQRSFVLTLPAVAGTRTAQATLLNSLGQAVRSNAITLNAGGTEAPMETTGLAAGIYTLRVQAGSQVATIKVAINN